MCLHKNLYVNVHKRVMHTSHKVEAPQCPSTDAWINGKWNIHTMRYFPVQKRNGVLIHATTWVNWKTHWINKAGTKAHGFYGSVYAKCPNRKIHRGKKYISISQGLGKREGGMTAHIYLVSFQGDESISE